LDQLTLFWKILISDLSLETRNLNFFCIVLKPDWLLLFPFRWKKKPDRYIGPPPLKEKGTALHWFLDQTSNKNGILWA
jgi:hypothetical protein